jgi:hypothetical protein
MRNPVTAIIPPNGSLSMRIDPPMSPNEKIYLMTLRGAETATVNEIDRGQIVVTNPSAKISPVFVYVGPSNLHGVADFVQNILRRNQP